MHLELWFSLQAPVMASTLGPAPAPILQSTDRPSSPLGLPQYAAPLPQSRLLDVQPQSGAQAPSRFVHLSSRWKPLWCLTCQEQLMGAGPQSRLEEKTQGPRRSQEAGTPTRCRWCPGAARLQPTRRACPCPISSTFKATRDRRSEKGQKVTCWWRYAREWSSRGLWPTTAQPHASHDQKEKERLGEGTSSCMCVCVC